MRSSLSSALVLLSIGGAFSATIYISPSGSNTAAGTSEATAFKTFAKAFATMKRGDELVLLNGTYSAASGTGYINWNDGCPTCGQPPSGLSPAAQTVVRAQNPGNVIVDGGAREGLFIGRSARKDSCIKIQGITFEGGGYFWNTTKVTVKDCGFHRASMNDASGFSIGVSDNTHMNGNTYNLVEDCWIWGKERIIASNYNSDYNVWRRVVIRGDGCNSSGCVGSGNPNVGFTVYDSRGCSIQNMVIVDRVLGGGSPFGSFATAQHTPNNHLLGPNEWLGCIALNSEDGGFVFGADQANDRTVTMRNIVAWGCSENINIPPAATNILLENITVGYSRSADNLRIDPAVTVGILRNVISCHASRYGINSPIKPAYTNVCHSVTKDYNQSECSVGRLDLDPLQSGLRHLVRIEEGSPLKKTGYGGADYGANILFRYGMDGARSGDADYNILSSARLWPWPNEERIKKDFSGASTRGFCAAGQTLTKYIWEYLGNPIPAVIYPQAETEKTGQNELSPNREIGLSCRPNPFTSALNISFALPGASDVSLRLYSVDGRLVSTLCNRTLGRGLHRFKPDLGRLNGSGIYVVNMTVNGSPFSTKVFRL